MSLGRLPVRSMARSTASSHSLEPLDFTSRRPMMVPVGAARTSITASGLPLTTSVNTMLGLTALTMSPA